MPENRLEWMFRSAGRLAAVGVGVGAVAAAQVEDESQEYATQTPPDGKAWRIGVISARRQGNPERINGHTWHFAQYLHSTIDLPTAQKHLDPGNKKYFAEIVRNPACDFGILPLPDARISHDYFEMFNMARAYREMIRTRVELTSHESILDVTPMIYAGAKSLQEKSRLVSLAEVLD